VRVRRVEESVRESVRESERGKQKTREKKKKQEFFSFRFFHFVNTNPPFFDV